MPGETRAPRALLLTRSEQHREKIRDVLEARGWQVVAAAQEDARSIIRRQGFALTVIEFAENEPCGKVHDLCREVDGGCGGLLVVAGASRTEEAAAVVAEGPGDLLVAPFNDVQLNTRIALAEARLNGSLSPRHASSSASRRMLQMEKTLRYHRASMDELFQNAPEGIAIVDQNDRVIRTNHEFTRMFGYTEEEALGRPINDLLAPDQLMEEALALTRGVRTKKLVVEETQRRCRDGTLLDVSVLATPIAVGDGLDGAFAIYRDISKRKAQERALLESESRLRSLFNQAERVNVELRERTREIETSMAAKTRLYSALNHELRTPISAVLLYQELLLAGSMGALLPDQRDALERSHAAARHLLDVVRDVLDLSRIEAGAVGSRLVEVELARLVHELADTAQPLAELHGSMIRVHVPESIPNIVTDPQKLRQIILNLLSNAAKFGGSAPIEVSCQWEQEFVSIEVRDRGIGIAEQYHSLIFEDFMQVEEGRGGGTGLGLAISRRLADLLGGRLEVESELGVGSIFRLTLPLTAPESAALQETLS